MRIGIDASKALGRPDGIASYTAGLVRALARVAPEQEVRLYGLLTPLDAEGVRARLGELPPSFEVASTRQPLPGEVEVFHGPAYALPAAETSPAVLTLHDLSFLSHPHCHTLDNRLHCLKGLTRALARGAKLVAVSEATRRDAVARLALAEDAIAVVPPAAHELFHPMPAAEARRTAARLGLGEEPYVLAVGVLEPRKNLRRLVAAFGALPEAVRERHLLAVAGPTGWLAEDPRSWPEVAALGGRVRFLGEVAAQDLPALYAAAAVFAYPSLAEGFGLPVLEAMCCGAPVLTSEVSSLPEVVGEAGLLVDPLEPSSIRAGLAALLADPQRRQALAAAGLERAGRFSWEASARAMLHLYRTAAEVFC
ncbi:MAG TPA: glycosyltransferase family 1 protein [Thermoanaerobaculia bacterium]|nr:glycosyltransferase family 1 protein [Thermoanaerobaculia bacterium]